MCIVQYSITIIIRISKHFSAKREEKCAEKGSQTLSRERRILPWCLHLRADARAQDKSKKSKYSRITRAMV